MNIPDDIGLGLGLVESSSLGSVNAFYPSGYHVFAHAQLQIPHIYWSLDVCATHPTLRLPSLRYQN